MSKKIFISFSHKNLDFRNDLRAMFAAWDGPVEATPVYLDEDLRSQGEAAVENKIKEILEPCRGLLLVVGQNVHSSEWIDYEIKLAAGWNIEWAPVRHPRSTAGLPKEFRSKTVVDWDRDVIAEVVAGW